MLLAQAASDGSLLSTLLPFLLIGAAVWFLMIRPQRKRSAERKEMIESLTVGAEIVTIGGIHGEVEALTDDWVDLLVTEDVVIRVTRQSIGSIKSGDRDDDQLLAQDGTDEVDPAWPDTDDA